MSIIEALQWTGAAAQQEALARVARVSAALHEKAAGSGDALLEAARWRLLRAETSCNLYWGEAWVPRCHADLDAADLLLTR